MNKPKNITILSDSVLDLLSPVVVDSQEDKESYIDCLLQEMDPVGVNNHCYKFTDSHNLYNFI
jgi:hypothetical protein